MTKFTATKEELRITTQVMINKEELVRLTFGKDTPTQKINPLINDDKYANVEKIPALDVYSVCGYSMFVYTLWRTLPRKTWNKFSSCAVKSLLIYAQIVMPTNIYVDVVERLAPLPKFIPWQTLNMLCVVVNIFSGAETSTAFALTNAYNKITTEGKETEK